MPSRRSKYDWVSCTRSCTAAVIHHPNGIDISSHSFRAPHQSQADTSVLCNYNTRSTQITEISSLLIEDHFVKSQCISSVASKLLERAKCKFIIPCLNSVYSEQEFAMVVHSMTVDGSLVNQPSVQNKLLDVTNLEGKNCVWKRIRVQQGLTAGHGQLSFLLRAGSDIYPPNTTKPKVMEDKD